MTTLTPRDIDDLIKKISKIETNHPDGGQMSQAQIIWQARAKQEITQEEAEQYTALLTADTVFDHVPTQYPRPSIGLTDYVVGRANGTCLNRDSVLSLKNGEWIQLVNRIQTRNMADYDHLMWAGRICKQLGALKKCEILREMVMRHIEIDNAFSKKYFKDALDAQLFDSEQRERESGKK